MRSWWRSRWLQDPCRPGPSASACMVMLRWRRARKTTKTSRLTPKTKPPKTKPMSKTKPSKTKPMSRTRTRPMTRRPKKILARRRKRTASRMPPCSMKTKPPKTAQSPSKRVQKPPTTSSCTSKITKTIRGHPSLATTSRNTKTTTPSPSTSSTTKSGCGKSWPSRTATASSKTVSSAMSRMVSPLGRSCRSVAANAPAFRALTALHRETAPAAHAGPSDRVQSLRAMTRPTLSAAARWPRVRCLGRHRFSTPASRAIRTIRGRFGCASTTAAAR